MLAIHRPRYVGLSEYRYTRSYNAPTPSQVGVAHILCVHTQTQPRFVPSGAGLLHPVATNGLPTKRSGGADAVVSFCT